MWTRYGGATAHRVMDDLYLLLNDTARLIKGIHLECNVIDMARDR